MKLNKMDLSVARYFGIATFSFLICVSAASQSLAAPSIVRMSRNAAPTEHGKYPPEYIAHTARPFDGSYSSSVDYLSQDGKFSAGIWQSGPGTFVVAEYPHDEFCHVLEGRLLITDKEGRRQVFVKGDSFVIPKGWAGTWAMPVHFKKEGVTLYEVPQGR